MRTALARMFLCVVLYLGPRGAAKAGLLDVLFAAPAPRSLVEPMPRYAHEMPPTVLHAPSRSAHPSASRRHWPRRLHPHHRVTPVRHALQKERLPAKDVLDVLGRGDAAQQFLQDPTLRPGDVIVLPKGLLVFRGRKAASHSAEDFAPVAKSRVAHRAELVALERGNAFWASKPANVVVLTMARSPAVPVLTIRPGQYPVERISASRPDASAGTTWR